MSFLIDPPLLVGAGVAVERLAPDAATARRIEKAVVATFVVTSVSLYLNRRWTRWLWELCRAESGRDWMLNSGVLHLEHDQPSPIVHAAAAAFFATYPAWMAIGRRLARVEQQ